MKFLQCYLKGGLKWTIFSPHIVDLAKKCLLYQTSGNQGDSLLVKPLIIFICIFLFASCGASSARFEVLKTLYTKDCSNEEECFLLEKEAEENPNPKINELEDEWSCIGAGKEESMTGKGWGASYSNYEYDGLLKDYRNYLSPKNYNSGLKVARISFAGEEDHLTYLFHNVKRIDNKSWSRGRTTESYYYLCSPTLDLEEIEVRLTEIFQKNPHSDLAQIENIILDTQK